MLFPGFFLRLVFWQCHRASLPDRCVGCPTVLHHGYTGCSGCCHLSPPDAAPLHSPGLYPLLTLSHLADTHANRFVSMNRGQIFLGLCVECTKSVSGDPVTKIQFTYTSVTEILKPNCLVEANCSDLVGAGSYIQSV